MQPKIRSELNSAKERNESSIETTIETAKFGELKPVKVKRSNQPVSFQKLLNHC
jgi:hypothetical protein